MVHLRLASAKHLVISGAVLALLGAGLYYTYASNQHPLLQEASIEYQEDVTDIAMDEMESASTIGPACAHQYILMIGEDDSGETIYYGEKDGYLVIGKKQTEVPAAICDDETYFGANVPEEPGRYRIYKGTTKAYIIDEIGYSIKADNTVRSRMAVYEIAGIPQESLTQIGTQSDPWYFTEGKTVVRVTLYRNPGGPNAGATTTTVTGADPATFRPLGHYYARDASHVYFRDQVLIGADPASFHTIYEEPLGFESKAVAIGRDDAAIYFKDKRSSVVGAGEYRWFPVISWRDPGFVFADSSHLYYYAFYLPDPSRHIPLPPALASGEFLTLDFCKDTNEAMLTDKSYSRRLVVSFVTGTVRLAATSSPFCES